MLSLVLLALVAAPSGSTVTPFKTEVAPRVDPVFGDISTVRRAVDRFLLLQTEMEQVRSDFSMSVHSTLAQLGGPSGRPKQVAKTCPPGALALYARAFQAGGRYLALGRQLEARFREIRRADELGDAAGLTPDYRLKVKKAKDLYAELLRDYREMRVAFYDQLGAEMRHAGCPLPAGPTPYAPTRPGTVVAASDPAAPDPSDLASWALEEGLAPESTGEAGKELTAGKGAKPTPAQSAAAPAIWINIDNSHCALPSHLAIDGQQMGPVSGHKKVAVRTRAGPHEVCVLPTSDKRKCGDAGTLRRAYLYEGWTLVVRCEK